MAADYFEPGHCCRRKLFDGKPVNVGYLILFLIVNNKYASCLNLVNWYKNIAGLKTGQQWISTKPKKPN
jgi:hypothetical protein